MLGKPLIGICLFVPGLDALFGIGQELLALGVLEPLFVFGTDGFKLCGKLLYLLVARVYLVL
ncbi:MAG: hypothetical protein K2L88_01115 [Clostridiales bacterium]|nr:hypothetical protein [Clostridiales bacterium]